MEKKSKDLWGVSLSKIEDDGTRYGSMNPNAVVNNGLLGLCRVRAIMDLEKRGAIVYQEDVWKIKTHEISHTDKKTGLPGLRRVPTDEWYAYEKRDSFRDRAKEYQYDYDDGTKITMGIELK